MGLIQGGLVQARKHALGGLGGVGTLTYYNAMRMPCAHLIDFIWICSIHSSQGIYILYIICILIIQVKNHSHLLLYQKRPRAASPQRTFKRIL